MNAKKSNRPSDPSNGHGVQATVDELLMSALDRGGRTLETGRSIVTFQSAEEGVRLFTDQGVRVADARDFQDQAVVLENAGDAEALVFPEIGAAVVGGGVLAARALTDVAERVIASIELEDSAF